MERCACTGCSSDGHKYRHDGGCDFAATGPGGRLCKRCDDSQQVIAARPDEVARLDQVRPALKQAIRACDVDAVRPFLSHHSPAVRIAARDALIKIDLRNVSSKEAVGDEPGLSTLADSQERRVREAALNALTRVVAGRVAQCLSARDVDQLADLVAAYAAHPNGLIRTRMTVAMNDAAQLLKRPSLSNDATETCLRVTARLMGVTGLGWWEYVPDDMLTQMILSSDARQPGAPLYSAALAMRAAARTERELAVKVLDQLLSSAQEPAVNVRSAAVSALFAIPTGELVEMLDRASDRRLWSRLLDAAFVEAISSQTTSLIGAVADHLRRRLLRVQGAAWNAEHFELIRRVAAWSQSARLLDAHPQPAKPIHDNWLASQLGLLLNRLARDANTSMRAALTSSGAAQSLEFLCGLSVADPSGTLTPNLKDLVRVLRPAMLDHRVLVLTGSHDDNYAVDNAIAALLTAFGACAASSRPARLASDRRVEEEADSRRAPLRQRLDALIASHGTLIEEYNRTVQGLPAHVPISPLSADIVSASRIGEKAERGINALISSLRERLTGGFGGSESLTVFERIQAHRERIEASAREIKTVRKAIDDIEADLWARLSPGRILMRIAADSNSSSTFIRQGAIRGLGFLLDREDLDQEDRGELTTCIGNAVTADTLGHLRTWEVRLLPDSCLTELVLRLHVGLTWLARHVSTLAIPSMAELTMLGRRMRAQIPEVVEFLGRYPLRLMTLADREGVFGECETSGYRAFYVTRFQPPIRVGPVHERSVIIEDFTQPNRIGIAAELFEDVLLLLPVIYHEHLHAKGLDNEAEVHLRMLLFLRALVAKLAPDQDDRLPDWEERVGRSLAGVWQLDVVDWLATDFRRPEMIALLNGHIERQYGPRLSPAEATVRANAQRDQLDVSTRHGNISPEVLSWHPEQPYPMLLGSGSTEASRQAGRFLVDIVSRRCQAPRRIESFAEVVGGPEYASEISCQISTWEIYCRRPGALSRFGDDGWRRALRAESMARRLSTPHAAELLRRLQQLARSDPSVS